MRLVLDTNVWLDWLVFDDPGIAPLKAAVARGDAEIFIDAPCAGELEEVLSRQFKKKGVVIGERAHGDDYRAIARLVAGAQSHGAAEVSDSGTVLPVCRDADDQKFLELARASAADFLVTKDRALLALGRRRSLAFRIVAPPAAAAALDSRRRMKIDN